MTIFGLNSPELFVLLVIALIILGTKRIEIGLNLILRLLKFLLSNESTLEKIDKKKELTKEIEKTAKKEEITKIQESDDAKDKELTKEIEKTAEKEDKLEKKSKIAVLNNKEKKSIKTKDPRGNVKDKNVKKLKPQKTESIEKDKTVIKSKTINVQEEQLEK